MEEEIKNQELSVEQPAEGIKQGINPFIFDGPIGRLRYLITFLCLMLFSCVYMIGYGILHHLYGKTSAIPVFIALIAFLIGFNYWIGFVAFAKRLYDVFGEKSKAIFYTVIWYVTVLACSFIPVMKIPLRFAVLAILITFVSVRGKLVK